MSDHSAKVLGTCKWFDHAKGYGFILNEKGEDLFVHYRSILIDGYKALREGQPVYFKQVRGEKGLQAVEVEPS